MERPKPVFEQPKPPVERPKPADQQQKPINNMPEPAETRPKPPVERPKPAEKKPEPENSPAPAPAGDWWEAALEAPEVKKLMAYHFLSSPGAFRVSEAGGAVTLATADGFAMMMADTAEVKDTLARVISALLGRPVKVRLSEAEEQAAPRIDRLDELSIFGNVKMT